MVRIKIVAKVSVKLTKELAEKIEQWKGYGFRPSDTVRLALSLLPNSPDEMRNESSQIVRRIKPLQNQQLQIELKDEKVVLKALQEW
jgi:hypothetical protein